MEHSIDLHRYAKTYNKNAVIKDPNCIIVAKRPTLASPTAQASQLVEYYSFFACQKIPMNLAQVYPISTTTNGCTDFDEINSEESS